eukprot:scaffold96187_cov34-Prasinocladus_malaysianus.AAC.1
MRQAYIRRPVFAWLTGRGAEAKGCGAGSVSKHRSAGCGPRQAAAGHQAAGNGREETRGGTLPY